MSVQVKSFHAKEMICYVNAYKHCYECYLREKYNTLITCFPHLLSILISFTYLSLTEQTTSLGVSRPTFTSHSAHQLITALAVEQKHKID